MTLVTPYLPKMGIIAAREHIRAGKPAFVRAYERVADGCPNCQDIGFVLLIRADSGPYTKFVPSGIGKVVCWFDGDGEHGKGWYLIMDTLAYSCPKCGGNLEPDYQDGTINNMAAKKLADVMRSKA